MLKNRYYKIIIILLLAYLISVLTLTFTDINNNLSVKLNLQKKILDTAEESPASKPDLSGETFALDYHYDHRALLCYLLLGFLVFGQILTCFRPEHAENKENNISKKRRENSPGKNTGEI